MLARSQTAQPNHISRMIYDYTLTDRTSCSLIKRPCPRISYIECNPQVLGTSALDVKSLTQKDSRSLTGGRDRYIDRRDIVGELCLLRARGRSLQLIRTIACLRKLIVQRHGRTVESLCFLVRVNTNHREKSMALHLQTEGLPPATL